MSSNNPLGDEQIVHFDLVLDPTERRKLKDKPREYVPCTIKVDHLATADEIDHMDDPWEAGHVEIVHAHGTLPDLSDAEIKPFTDPRQLPGL